MTQKEIANWLKGITILIALMGTLFFAWMLPARIGELAEVYPDASSLKMPGYVFCGVTAVICYGILYQFWQVCRQIGRDNSFSAENARSFKRMSGLFMIMSLFWFAGLIAAVLAAGMHPEVMVRMLFVIFFGVVFSIAAAALSHLVLKAYEMKKENDFTI